MQGPHGPVVGLPLPGQCVPTIAAAAVSLRALGPEDADDLFTIFSDPRVTRYWSSPAMQSRDEARSLVEEIGAHFRAHTLYQWGIADRGGDRIVGTATLAALDSANRRAEIGFALAADAQGQGRATAAVTVLLDFAFSVLGLHRVEADVDPDNAPSLHLLERLGFRHEGRLRERWLALGEPRDAVMLGLLAREWRQRNTEGSTR